MFLLRIDKRRRLGVLSVHIEQASAERTVTMNFTEQDVLAYVEQEDVRFIRLAFCDVFGKQKNIAILPGELPRAFRHGIAIDASAIAGFGGLAVHHALKARRPKAVSRGRH